MKPDLRTLSASSASLGLQCLKNWIRNKISNYLKREWSTANWIKNRVLFKPNSRMKRTSLRSDLGSSNKRVNYRNTNLTLSQSIMTDSYRKIMIWTKEIKKNIITWILLQATLKTCNLTGPKCSKEWNKSHSRIIRLKLNPESTSRLFYQPLKEWSLCILLKEVIISIATISTL